MFKKLIASLNSAEIACFIKDAAGNYEYINAAGAKQLGKTQLEVISSSDQELFHIDSAHLMIERDKNIICQGSPAVYDSVARASHESGHKWKRFYTAKIPYESLGSRKLIGLSAVIDSKLEERTAEIIKEATAVVIANPQSFANELMQETAKLSSTILRN